MDSTDFKSIAVTTIDGEATTMGKVLEGKKVALIVNVASA